MRKLEITRLRGPISVTVSFAANWPFLIKPFVNRAMVPLAKQHLHRFRRQMTMPRADVDHQRIRAARACAATACPSLHKRLSNQMLDNRPMWTGCCIRHTSMQLRFLQFSSIIVNNYLAKNSKIYQIVAICGRRAQKRIEDYLQRVEFASLEEFPSTSKRPFPPFAGT